MYKTNPETEKVLTLKKLSDHQLEMTMINLNLRHRHDIPSQVETLKRPYNRRIERRIGTRKS